MYEFLRNLFASEQPVMERFNVVDPTAVGNNVRSITLAYTPATDESPTAAVSLFWTDSKNKVYEKGFQDELQAQNLFGSMKQDLQEAADLTRTEKMESAASLVRSLLKRYAIYTDELVDGNPEPKTLTNADLKLSKVQNPLVNRTAKVVMQNLFFETPEEMKKYQDMQKGNKPNEGKPAGDFMDDLPGAEKGKAPGADKDLGDEVGEDGLAPSSLSYEDYEKQKAQEQKSLTKRIEREVKEQVKSALEQKIASTFDETDDELIDAMRKKGRTWEEIKNYFIKELQYEKDSVAAYIDALREADHGQAAPGPKPPMKEPAAPKPPTDLVSPETHDKLVKEVEDKTPATPEPEHEIEKQDMALGEIAMQNTEITKIAEEPLETVPRAKPDMGGDFDFLPPESDMADDVNDDPAASPDPGDMMQEQEEELVPGPDTKVYVMRDYQTGDGGFEGTLVSKYKSGGDEFAVVDVNGDMKEVPMRDVKRASMFRNLVKIVAARKEKREAEKAEKASAEFKSITSELQALNLKVAEQAIAYQRGEGYLMRWITDYELDSDERVRKITRSELSYDQKVAEIHKLIPEIMNNLSDDEIDIRSSDWDAPEINIGPLSHYIEGEEEMYQMEKEDQGKTSASLKEAAPPKPGLSPADPQQEVGPKVVGPTLEKKKIAPPEMRKEVPVLAPEAISTLYNKVKDTEAKLDAIKTAAAEMKKKIDDDIRKFREEAGEQALLQEKADMLNKLFASIEPLEAKVIDFGTTLMKFEKEETKEPVDWTAAEKLKRIYAKFEEAEKYIDNALNGAQKDAKPIIYKRLVEFPHATPKAHQLSKFDKTADLNDVMNYIFENLQAAYNVLTEITGGEPEAVPA